STSTALSFLKNPNMILFLFKNLSFHYTIFPHFLLSLSYLFSGTKPIFQKNKPPDWATLFL
ncbi:hypothetical protein AZJ46_07415, partial [Streptococcus pneumoniae]